MNQPSLKHIADLLGINPSTVSRALAGKSGVSEQLRNKITSVAEQLNYRPDTAARSLRTGSRFGLSVVTTANPTEITSKRNYFLFSKGKDLFGAVTVLLVSEGRSADALCAEIISSKCRGVVLSGLGKSFTENQYVVLEQHRIPAVSLDCAVQGKDSIVIDRKAGMEEAVRFLFSKGCSRPLFLLHKNSGRDDPRKSGILAGLRSLGLPQDQPRFYYFSGSNIQDGYAIGKEVLEDKEKPDAVFTFNDHMALGFIRAASEKGIIIPDDLLIIGFDDVDFAAYTKPSLTTIRQPVSQCVNEALRLIETRIKSPDLPPRMKVFPAELIRRESAP
ncbi:MAG: LacI family DNA-binding transcriptional regulator [Spirochaetia bacterium]